MSVNYLSRIICVEAIVDLDIIGSGSEVSIEVCKFCHLVVGRIV